MIIYFKNKQIKFTNLAKVNMTLKQKYDIIVCFYFGFKIKTVLKYIIFVIKISSFV